MKYLYIAAGILAVLIILLVIWVLHAPACAGFARQRYYHHQSLR